MLPLRLALLATLALPTLATSSIAAAKDGDTKPVTSPVSGHIDVVLTSSVLDDATVGVHVLDLRTGKELYARGADTPLNPASNAKLVTTAAALTVLGPEHRYVTRLYRHKGALQGSVIKGDVFLRGSGDPLLVTEDLYLLAHELRSRGIRKITGGVVVDATAFDRDELPPEFDQKEEMASYRAPSGATSINFNTFVVRVQAGANVGDDALAGLNIDVPSIELINTAKTVAGFRRKLYADLEHTDDKTTVRLSGSIGIDAGAGAYRYPIANPSQYAGEVLAVQLRQAGIRLGRRAIRFQPAPSDRRALASHFSPALSVLLRSVNKFSNNFMAEQVLKTLATDEPASFASALARVREQLVRMGIDLQGAVLKNGSGLYDANRLTPRQLTGLLARMATDFRYRSEFFATLSTMGVDGTARSRLEDTPAVRWVRVKTGTLDGISALSGYVGAPGREPIAFSILFNDLPRGRTGSARKIQDAIVEILADHAAGRPLPPIE